MATADAASDLVLVTGTSGYVASHVTQQLLEQGFRVRGTVRSLKNEQKVEPLRQLCPNAKYSLELVEADLQNESCWLPAVQDCKYVMHIASPFPDSSPADENEVIKPAVDGTLNVLKACVAAKCVQRVVLTSSVVAVSNGFSKGGHFDETNWSNIDEVDPYHKSKTLAEKAAWDFVGGLSGTEKFELAVVNPTYIMGPVLIKTFTTSMVITKRLLEHAMPMLPRINFAIVDARDVAKAHIQAMKVPEAAGHRHIIAGSNLWISDLAQIYVEEFKEQGYNIPTRNAPDIGIKIYSLFDKTTRLILPSMGKVTTYDTSRMKNVLGVEARDVKDTLIDMAYTMIENGQVKKTKKYRGPTKGAMGE